jgi:5-methylcytosine-specific restriction endonuclease McrA
MTVPEARRALVTVAAAESCPNTHAALVAGEVSLAQAHEIVRTEAEVPGSEGELLAVARGGSLGVVRDRARKRRVEAITPEELHAKQRTRRECTHWRDELGMVCGRFALTPEVGVPFVNRLDAETDRVRREARRKGTDEPRAASAADALARLVTGAGKGRSNRADVVYVYDVNKGVAHIVGGGPVPVSVVREVAADAFVKVVFHDGVEITKVAHLGRHIPAELRTALELGAPPDFDGVTCAEPGCHRRYGLEWDHLNPVANGGITSRENLKPKCDPHHRDKTARDRKAGLLRGRGDGRGPP